MLDMAENIHIKNPSELNQKIAKLKKDGINSLHIVADFDSTLTKAFVDGEKVFSAFEQFRKHNNLGNDYTERSYELKNHYRPLEFSKKLSVEEKKIKMNEWWEKHWKLMIECGITLDSILNIVEKGKVENREGTEELFELLRVKRVPFLILSSGLGDFITAFYKQQNMLSENVHIISNFFKFDKNGKSVDAFKPFITSYSKGTVLIKNFPYHKEIEERRNVILLGDSLGDTNMSDGIKYDCVVKIGFINDRKEQDIDEFGKLFDVLILDDGDMYYVLEMLKDIVNKD